MKFENINLETLKKLFNQNGVNMISITFGDEFEGYGYNYMAALRIFNDKGESKIVEYDEDGTLNDDLLEEYTVKIYLESINDKEFEEIIKKMNEFFMFKMEKGFTFTTYYKEGYESEVYTLSEETINEAAWQKMFKMMKY